MHTQFSCGNIMRNVNLEQLEENGKITLTWILRNYVLKFGNVWNWLVILSNDEFPY